MLKISLPIKEFTNFMDKLIWEFLGLRMRNIQGIVFI